MSKGIFFVFFCLSVVTRQTAFACPPMTPPVNFSGYGYEEGGPGECSALRAVAEAECNSEMSTAFNAENGACEDYCESNSDGQCTGAFIITSLEACYAAHCNVWVVEEPDDWYAEAHGHYRGHCECEFVVQHY
jgi:hypothetical protein